MARPTPPPAQRHRIRRRWIAVPAVTATAVAGAVVWTVTANASTLLSADFDNRSGSWSKSGGNWSVVRDDSKVLRQSNATSGNARQFSGSSSWTSYTLQARVKALSLAQAGSAAGVLAHATGSTSFDRLVLLGSGRAELQSVRSGRVQVLGSIGVSGATGAWHTVRVQESGGQVAGWVDGKLVGRGASQSGSGRIGVQTLYGTAEFDDVLVDSSTTSVPAPNGTSTTAPTSPAPATSTARPTTPTSTPTSPTSTPTGSAGTTPAPIGTPPAGGRTTGGFADVNAPMLGGGGQATEVTSLAGLKSALAGGPQIIRVKGNFTCSGDLTVPSYRTIIGVGSGSGLTGCGLSMKGVTSVIVQNLKIAKVQAGSGSGDAIHIEKSSHIWIDHNDLSSDQSSGKDFYDGLVDITRGSDYVTVSWNYFHDHYKAVLIGHSDSNAAEDTGKLHVTLHHNYFSNINSRMPSLRFGTGHVYDNYFVNGSTGTHSRMGAQMLVQNNVYRSVNTPIMTNKDSSQDGYVNESGNDFGTGKTSVSQTGSFTRPPYAFTLDPAGSVVSKVTAGAGTGHIG